MFNTIKLAIHFAMHCRFRLFSFVSDFKEYCVVRRWADEERKATQKALQNRWGNV